MNISTLKRAILLCRAARITPLIWGHRGIGKSSIIRNLCTEEKWGCIDFRVSQIEAADLRGLADRQNGQTVFLPPAEMPVGDIEWLEYEEQVKSAGERAWAVVPKLQPRLKNGILFLDEINRGQDDVSQALFQLVLDHSIGHYILPPGWSIVAAGNFMEGYMSNGFTDPAFLNRFCHLTLSADETTQPEWVEYMEAMHTTIDKDGRDVNYASRVIEFAAQNTEHLYGKVKGELGFSIMPSPRSWDAVARVHKALGEKDFGNDAKKMVIAGLIGRELAESFTSYSCPVRPDDLITHGVEAMRAELKKIIDDKDHSRNMTMGLMWGVAGRLRKSIDTDEHMAKVALDFTRWLCLEARDKDIAIAFCNHMVSGGSAPARLKSAMISNPNVGKLLSRWTNGKSFSARLNAIPELANLVSQTSWGKVGHEG